MIGMAWPGLLDLKGADIWDVALPHTVVLTPKLFYFGVLFADCDNDLADAIVFFKCSNALSP